MIDITAIRLWLSTNGFLVTLSFVILIYSIFTMYIYTNDPKQIVSTYRTYTDIAVFAGIIVICGYAAYTAIKSTDEQTSDPISMMRYVSLFSMGTVILGIFVMLLILMSSDNPTTKSFGIILGYGLFIIGIATGGIKLAKLLGGKIWDVNLKTVFWKISNIILELKYSLQHYLFVQQITTRGWMSRLVAIQLGIIGSYFVIPIIKERYIVGNGYRIGKKIQRLNSENTLLSYDPSDGTISGNGINETTSAFAKIIRDVSLYVKSGDSGNRGDNIYPYNYGISGWFFVESHPPNTNKQYTTDTPIFTYGGHPTISFNPSENLLKIVVNEYSDTDYDRRIDTVVYSSNNFPLQKWNHIVVNGDAGRLDVFINNELVVSRTKIYISNLDGLPMKLDVGYKDGLHGAVGNVSYYKQPLDRMKIAHLYVEDKPK